MRKLFFAVTYIAVLAALVACKNETNGIKLPNGYSTEERKGGSTFEDVNIKSITATEPSSTELKITYVCGSELTYSGETSPSELPAYTVSKQIPYSVSVKTENVVFRDFERTEESIATDSLLGVFYDKKAELLTFQFAYDPAFAVREEGNTLVISVAPFFKHNENDYAYYVTANTYEYYCNGLWQAEGFYPTITRSGEIIFISDEYKSVDEANAELTRLQSESPDFKASYKVIAKYYNELPIFDKEADNALCYSAKPVKDTDAQVNIPDGMFLVETKAYILYERIVSDGESIHSEIYAKTQLPSKNTDSKFISYEFESIEDASVSPDERKLAVLENAQSGSHLYVFDMQNGKLLYDLSDSGFGKRIAGFIWNDLGTAIYAISGTDGIAVHMYDFTIKDETKRHSIIYKGDTDECTPEMYNGNLYFISSDNEGNSFVSQVSPETGIAGIVTDGTEIKIYKNLAAISFVSKTDAQNSMFYILNLQTSERITVTNDFAVYDFFWSEDGNRLYYVKSNTEADDITESDKSSTQSDYPFTVFEYDAKTKSSAKLYDISPYIRMCIKDGNLWLMKYEMQDKALLYAGTFVVM